MGAWHTSWLFTKKFVSGAVIGLTISDRYGSINSVRGSSMYPTFSACDSGFSGLLKADFVLVEKFCLGRYKFSHGDVIVFKSPTDHRKTFAKRLIALPGETVQFPESSEIIKIPEGHCWAEGDNAAHSFDSRSFGSLAIQRVTPLFFIHDADPDGFDSREGNSCDLAPSESKESGKKDGNR